jgi:hypothetical protein
MELLPSADRVVREILPAAFDAAGMGAAAASLRGLGRLACHRSVLLAAAALRTLRMGGGRDGVVRDASFWCEKAVWAAASSDAAAFSRYVDAAHASIREAMSAGGPLT